MYHVINFDTYLKVMLFYCIVEMCASSSTENGTTQIDGGWNSAEEDTCDGKRASIKIHKLHTPHEQADERQGYEIGGTRSTHGDMRSSYEITFG